jgi:hypothetical protein
MKKNLTAGSLLLKHFDRLEVLITFSLQKRICFNWIGWPDTVL